MAYRRKVSHLAKEHTDARVDFDAVTAPYQRELLVHCYRILGSFEDAEDALQEAFLRAWRHFDSLRSQAALRAWLYKIATHVSLNMVASRRVRSMPTSGTQPANPRDPLPAPILDPIWLDPLPDEYVAGDSSNPEARYETKESVALAFLAALQLLPGRQRAILILRDVLAWNTTEIGHILDLSVPAVNSALQRARATLRKSYGIKDQTSRRAEDERDADLLARYIRAWEAGDSVALMTLLREDAILTMPPLFTWFRGRSAIKEFLDRHLFSANRSGAQFRAIPARANGCPALASYQRDETGVYRPGALLILTIQDDHIIQVDDFLALDDRLFLRFKLPLSL